MNAAPGAAGTLPSTAGPNLTVIDPSAGQSCGTAGPAGGPPAQIPLSWNVTGPPGPPGAPGTPGTPGAVGSPGTGNSYTVSLAPGPPGNRAPALGQVIVGSGRAGFSFPFLSEALVVASRFSSGAGAGSRRVALHDIQITKLIDKSSPKLFQAAVTGTHFSTVKIVLAKAGKVFETIKLSQVVVASVQLSGQAGGKTPSESVTLNFTKVEIAYK